MLDLLYIILESKKGVITKFLLLSSGLGTGFVGSNPAFNEKSRTRHGVHRNWNRWVSLACLAADSSHCRGLTRKRLVRIL